MKKFIGWILLLQIPITTIALFDALISMSFKSTAFIFFGFNTFFILGIVMIYIMAKIIKYFKLNDF
jgi:hypothetical protein